MARRCTIPLSHRNPKILESYVDYFIVGGYSDSPFTVNIFDRTKTSIVDIDVEKELRLSMQRQGVSNGQIISLDHIVIPRLRWSDRTPEKFEQKKRVVATMDNRNKRPNFGEKSESFETVCGLRRLILIGNVQMGRNTTEPFILSYNVQEQRADRVKLLTQI